jgi:hypothetical protein
VRIYVGFDDTDNLGAAQGTGKLARWFEGKLPEGCSLEGVLRQQLLVSEGIPYTSHNSAACVIVNAPATTFVQVLIENAIAHLEVCSLDGSDPGVCVAGEGDASLSGLVEFGLVCTRKIVTQKQAIKAASNVHLSGHGGTNDGIIGAAAAVGLTASGWNGRFIEYRGLRNFSDVVSVADLERSDMVVVSIDRDARVPAPEDVVHTKGWLRSRLWGSRAVVMVAPIGEGVWKSVGEKRKDRSDGKGNPAGLSENRATCPPPPTFHST